MAAIGALLVAGCGDAPQSADELAPIGPPPSLQDDVAAAAVVLTDIQAAELSVETVAARETAEAVELAMPGLVEPSPDDFAAVSAPIAGRVVRVLAHEGEPVRRGQTVAVIESQEFASLVASLGQARAGVGEARAALEQAEAEVALQQQQVERYTQLVAERISPQMRLDQARADLRRAQAQVQGAKARIQAAEAQVRGAQTQLAAVGVGAQAAELATRTGRVSISVTAPRSGLVDRHTIDTGGSVMAYEEMMTIVGQGELMARGQATPEQAARIRPGDGVSVRSTEDASIAVAATVTSVAPAASMEDRSVPVYVKIPAGRGLRPGQSVRMSVVTRGGAARLTVPLAAISYDGDRARVFVQTGPRTFEPRAVDLGPPGAETVTVLDGLAAGDAVAVTNVFDLKALARFEAYGEE